MSKLDIKTYTTLMMNLKPGLLAAVFNWAGAEHELLASKTEASPPLENKFYWDGAPNPVAQNMGGNSSSEQHYHPAVHPFALL
jgi:hypothetical protein